MFLVDIGSSAPWSYIASRMSALVSREGLSLSSHFSVARPGVHQPPCCCPVNRKVGESFGTCWLKASRSLVVKTIVG